MLDIVKAILVAVEVIISLLLVAIILIQKTKSEGLGLAFGSGMGETLFGSRAGIVLTKLTVILCIVFLVNTLFFR
jgi:preprotein translocase subunit SecG